MTVRIETESGSRYVLRTRDDGKTTVQDGRKMGVITTLYQPIESGRELHLGYKIGNSDEEQFVRSTPIVKIKIDI